MRIFKDRRRFFLSVFYATFLVLGGFLLPACGIAHPIGHVKIKKAVESRTAEDNFSCKDCNVIFISLTNLRADHLGFYGYSRNTSRHLDTFARNAVVFENAFSVASWTLPTAMSVYTSRYPFAHKVMTRYEGQEAQNSSLVRVRLSQDILTLVDVFNRNGYETASFNAAQDYLPQHGLTSRFKSNISSENDPSRRWGIYGSIYDITPEVIQWLDRNKERKFFLHIQAYDTHCPFAYPRKNDRFDRTYRGDVDFSRCYWTFDKTEPIVLKRDGREEKIYNVKTVVETNLAVSQTPGANGQPAGNSPVMSPDIWQRLDDRDIEHMVALYDGEIFNCDTQAARILKKIKQLGLTGKTIIVFFSEHGDMFGKYGRFMRGGPLRGTFYDDVLHVPLALYHPHVKPKRIKSLVSLIDLAPTILDFLEIEPPSEFRGTSLVSVLKDDSLRRQIFAGSLYTPEKGNPLFNYSTIIAAVRNEEWKMIREVLIYRNGETNNSYELFNIKDDPEELNNLADSQFEKLEELNGTLNEWFRTEGSKVGMEAFLKAVYNEKNGGK